MDLARLKDQFSFKRDKKLYLPTSDIMLAGKYFAWHYREKKSGIPRLLEKYEINNGITNVGKNYLFNVAFNSASQIIQSAWAMSLIDGGSTPTLSSNDTMGGHGGWTEFTFYSSGTRVAWGSVTSTAQLVANVTLCQFDITSDGVVSGGFITSANDKGGSTGLLWSTGVFGSPIPVAGSVDSIKLIYQVAA